MSRILSLRGKMLILTCSLLIGSALIVGVYVKALFADQMSQELLKRGISIARHLSTLSANAFVERNILYLDYLAKEHRQTEDDIVYIFMLGSKGEVLAHSFNDTYPVELAGVNPLSAESASSVTKVNAGELGMIYDIAVPVLDGRPGSIHMGLSASRVSNAVHDLVLHILMVIGVVGLIALYIALFASGKIARPITNLTKAVKALANGDRSLNLPVTTQDEIGRLTVAFNLMVENLSQAEARLNYQKRFLETLLDDIPVPVYYKDRQGLLLGCNRAYCDFWGCDKSSVVGRNTLEFHASREAEVHSAMDAEACAGHKAVRYELTIQDTANEIHQVIFQKAPFLDQDDRLAGLVGVILDITKERQADKFRSEFISTIAHEFQTPLATIIGYADLLQHGALDEMTARNSLETITSKAEMLSGMIDELLDLSRIEAGKMLCIELEYDDLRPVLIETLENFRISHPKHEVVTVIPDHPLRVLADQDRLVQVLNNLLSNASKYSAHGTRITFRAEQDKQGLRLMVVDLGIGMTIEQSSQVFEKFYRADMSNTAPSGTGLGLYICKAIVDAHGGVIEVSSSFGKGTQVTVCLPSTSTQYHSDSLLSESVVPV